MLPPKPPPIPDDPDIPAEPGVPLAETPAPAARPR
jgi:hypothetical protein